MSYHHLTGSERVVLDRMKRLGGYSLRDIARALGRHVSTVLRELRRNAVPAALYCPYFANVLYWQRRDRALCRPKLDDGRLMGWVREMLAQGWSPEQVAGRLRRMYPGMPERWISHETIYRCIWKDKRSGGTLYKHLRRHGRKYGKRGGGRKIHGRMAHRVFIDERPAIVDAQKRIGDWEGDTVFGRKAQGYIATFVERKSLYLVAGLMADKCARTLNAALFKSIRAVPRALLHTLTVDNGKEFAGFEEIERDLDMRVYFAHPYHSWERAINENTNGLLRQYMPRTLDFRTVLPKQLAAIVEKLNNRPRKKLDYRTPSEVFTEACVALGE